MRVVIYIRVSDESQVENYSLDAQERICRDFAHNQGWNVIAVYREEGFSGRKNERPLFQKMQNELKSLGIACILVYDLDRVMRNLELQLRFKRDLDRQKVALVSVMDGGLIDTATPEGIMQFQMKGMLSEWYSNQLSRKTKMGLLEKAMQGQWVGPVPQGYERTPDGSLQFSTDKEAVETIGALYASGQHSFTTVADVVNAAGWRSLHWRTGERRLFSREAIRWILKNKAYIGVVTCDGKEFPGKHPPIWSMETWEAIQRIMEGRVSTTRHPKHERSEAWLTGVAYCEQCGGRLWHQHAGKPNKKRSYYRYYRCSGIGRRECNAPMIAASKIEDHMFAILALLDVGPELRSRIIEGLQVPTETPKRKNTELEKKIARLRAVYAEGILTEAEYTEKLNTLLASNTEEVSEEPRTYSIEQINQVLDALPQILKQAKPEHLRSLVSGLVERVFVYQNKIVAITPRYDAWPLFRTISNGCLVGVADGRQYLTPNHFVQVELRIAA